ncbi:hypothetical protein METH109765_22335 [Mesobacillus thioparans]
MASILIFLEKAAMNRGDDPLSYGLMICNLITRLVTGIRARTQAPMLFQLAVFALIVAFRTYTLIRIF